jgi:phosphatidylserine/phosphatidylglycerophosphate/cardiolipin synthase-like enzyme
MSALAAAIGELCRTLPAVHVESLAAMAEELAAWSPEASSRLESALPAPHRLASVPLLAAWEAAPATPGLGLALALRSGLDVAADPRKVQIDVVCTGPSTMSTPVRLTSEVVCQLIDEASSRVLIVSYSSQKVARVVDALDRALARGVKVTMVLESPETFDASGPGAYGGYPIYRWPMERRPVGARLHAKVVAIDGATALLTSANLTPTAQDRSIELGLLVRGGSAPADIEAHFAGLIRSGELERA